MSDKDGNGGGNRTVFRPSPLQGLNQNKGAAPGAGAPAGIGAQGMPQGATPFGIGSTPPPAPVAHQQQPLLHDDIPMPAQPPVVRNRLVAEAGPVLALVASLRAGRARPTLPQFHKVVSAAVAKFEAIIKGAYPDETYQRAKYALCSTVDDIAQNLPGAGNDAAEWARRSMVVTFFHENIGGDRFWQLTEEMLKHPGQNLELIELFHACLAAGFEGRFRIMPDGHRRLQDIMNQLYSALEHPRKQSQMELVPHWRGETAPMAKVGFWNYIALASAIAFGILLLIYIIFRLILMETGNPSWDAMSGLMPADRLTLSRAAAPPPAPPEGAQAARLEAFLAPEIAAHEVVVVEDATTTRVRTTIGTLFDSGSDQLAPGKEDLFVRIGKAIQNEPGAVVVEGHADSDKPHGLTFPDNMALSGARANTVAHILAAQISDGSRITVQAYGDTRPLASNDTPDGKAQNRRVEVVLQKHD